MNFTSLIFKRSETPTYLQILLWIDYYGFIAMNVNNSNLNIALTGATGRVGKEVIDVVESRPNNSIIIAVNRDPKLDRVQDVHVSPAADLKNKLEDLDPDILIDFSGPKSSISYIELAARLNLPAVVGTTGFNNDQLERINKASHRIPILKEANFANGIHALINCLETLIEPIADYDIELIESHYNHKEYAPSGTAEEILEEIENFKGPLERIHGRSGRSPRRDDEIGVHSLRAGNITSEHEVLIAGKDELISVTHRTQSPRVFAEGAVNAANWLIEQSEGLYDYEDVIR